MKTNVNCRSCTMQDVIIIKSILKNLFKMYYIHTQVVLHISVILPHTLSPASNAIPTEKIIFIWIYS